MKSLPLLSHNGCSEKSIKTELAAFVMGIVNLTPDSFWKGSRYCGSAAAEKALQMVEEGAAIIDLGAESSRPGAEYISEEQEIIRLQNVIEEIRRHSQCCISVDTRKKNVFEMAFQQGADVLNDISALEDDEEMLSFVAEKKIPVILMHKSGNPAIMQKNTFYQNIFEDVDLYLRNRVEFVLQAGLPCDKILVDPGIGFGKDISGNTELIKRCGELCDGCYPVVMGLSRKSVIGQITGCSADERLAGTLAANLLAVQNGATVLRVHDVKETCQMLKVLERLKK